MIKNATVRVVIPSDSHLLLVIQHVVEFTIREGPLFEAMLMTRERNNPLFRGSPRQDHSRKPKARLRKSQRKKLEQILRELTPECDSIGDAMVWCADHATCAREICECIYESLTIDETPLHKKIARLYLISDLLANAASRGVRDVFYFRQYFGDLLTKIFAALGRTLRSVNARLKAEQFKQRVMSCFRAWEESVLYPTDVLVNSQNIFLGLMDGRDTDEEEEDLDGAPCDIDGVPIEETERNMPIFDDDNESGNAGPSGESARKPTGMFRADNWSTVGTVEPVKSKWEDDDSEPATKDRSSSPSTRNWSADASEGNSGNPASARTKESDDSDTDGEIEEKEDILASAAIEEERRKLMREVEVKVMALQDELESKRDPDIANKVKALREKEMNDLEDNLASIVKKRSKKDKKKTKKEGRKDGKDEYAVSKSSRDADRTGDRRRDTREVESRKGDRTRERDRDRDRERRRSRSRDRKRDSSRDRSRRDRR
ncbi:hypothetical protein TELCIR_01210 [Teladorsagia circumcincta]|uniref:CID domain-containing protein n=1 Tax=Teladorsagia circumcincta TaxID=45464 RepID=A0A2G9V2H0_TELCI|nr:hypothetical protein TELCIR_01210 [Teladorsagia circumcincta]